ncbi:MAG: DNA repair protein RecO [Capsulimonadales bacterium]|nr:DNA repair protein RecO [Capsulimonadales bacterium]
MANYRASALILRRIPLGETDKILTVFTREYGKFNAIAKGARRTTSRLAGATEPLVYAKMMLGEGMNLDVVAQSEVREAFPRLRADYGLFLRASYACELLDRITTERDPSSSMFDLLLSTLFILQRAIDPDITIHAFEVKLMAEAGYEPRLEECVRCERPFDGDRVLETAYSPHRGGMLCTLCAEQTRESVLKVSAETARTLRYLAESDDARGLAAFTPEPEVPAELNRLLREHLRLRLERDVRSTAFLDAFRLEAAGPDATT